MKRASEILLARSGIAALARRWRGAQAVGRLPGITFGAHSWGHPNLTRVTAARLQDELRRPLQWLRDRFTPVIDWLAYPYGCWSPEVEEAAGAAGYRAAVRVDGGWLPRAAPRVPAAARFHLPRLNVPAGVSAEGFVLRCAGLLSR